MSYASREKRARRETLLSRITGEGVRCYDALGEPHWPLIDTSKPIWAWSKSKSVNDGEPETEPFASSFLDQQDLKTFVRCQDYFRSNASHWKDRVPIEKRWNSKTRVYERSARDKDWWATYAALRWTFDDVATSDHADRLRKNSTLGSLKDLKMYTGDGYETYTITGDEAPRLEIQSLVDSPERSAKGRSSTMGSLFSKRTHAKLKAHMEGLATDLMTLNQAQADLRTAENPLPGGSSTQDPPADEFQQRTLNFFGLELDTGDRAKTGGTGGGRSSGMEADSSLPLSRYDGSTHGTDTAPVATEWSAI